ncbi:MAG: TlpA disulfide reductase family protein [Terriglobales bacterium]
MSRSGILLVITCCVSSLYGQQPADGPANEKAQKTFQEALQLQKKHQIQWALDGFKKADKQDGGHCLACQRNMVTYGIELRDWKTAETASDEMIAEAQGDKALALAHYHFGRVLLGEAIDRKKDELFTRAHEEMTKALAAFPNFPAAIYADGQALAYLKQDDVAKGRFEQFVRIRPEDDFDRQRALRFIDQPELARARMAPPFAVTTTDGQRLSLDDLKGKVVLLDFWATWCEACREALPHMKDLAKKFQGQPLLLLSVSLDDDEQKWKDFVAKNEMSWPQYRDGGFTGPIATLFEVKAIPHTFTIDADGVLQDEHVGDAAIEGKIKKLIARARDVEAQRKTQ